MFRTPGTSWKRPPFRWLALTTMRPTIWEPNRKAVGEILRRLIATQRLARSSVGQQSDRRDLAIFWRGEPVWLTRAFQTGQPIHDNGVAGLGARRTLAKFNWSPPSKARLVPDGGQRWANAGCAGS